MPRNMSVEESRRVLGLDAERSEVVESLEHGVAKTETFGV